MAINIQLPEQATIKLWQEQAKKENKTLLLLVAGDSAAGKNSRIGVINFKKILTTTTRPIRENEKNGVDYDFVTEDKFLTMKANNEFMETTNYGFQMYGTKKTQFDEKIINKEPCYLILDLNGIANIKSEVAINYPNDFLVKSIYYKINKETFISRITKRGENTSKEYIDNRWQENSLAHKKIESTPELIDLVVDTNKEIKEFIPKNKKEVTL